MKLSKLIVQLQKIQQKHGELECFDANYFGTCRLSIEEGGDDNFDADWNMPEKFLRIGEDR